MLPVGSLINYTIVPGRVRLTANSHGWVPFDGNTLGCILVSLASSRCVAC